MLQVEVARLHDDNREALSLAWVAGRDAAAAVRREAAASASLIGHLNLTHPNSIQVIGAFEAGTGGGGAGAPSSRSLPPPPPPPPPTTPGVRGGWGAGGGAASAGPLSPAAPA